MLDLVLLYYLSYTINEVASYYKQKESYDRMKHHNKKREYIFNGIVYMNSYSVGTMHWSSFNVF